MLYHKILKNKATKEYVTFIHGAGGSSNIWFKQIRSFQKKYNVLLIDLRGHGNSKSLPPGDEQDYTFTMIADDIIEVMDHLNIKASHFVGISLGTIIIREIAERFPKRIRSMILGGAILKFNLRGKLLMQLGNWFKSIIPYMFLYQFFAFIILPRKNHRASRKVFVNEAKKLEQDEFKKWFALTEGINRLLKFFRSREHSLPTMYVMGDQDYMFLPIVKKIVAKHRHSSLSVIENCGHVVNIEQAQIFNERSLLFLP